MPRFKEHDYSQGRFLSVDLGKQIQPGTFEYTVSHLIDHQIDLSVFDSKYRNDETGAPAFDPAVLLKIILVAYSRGMVSSRKIARACEENVLFIALTADSAPHFTTIADFVATMGPYIVPIFREVLAVCYAEGLIGKRMFAVDGCKISSNCSKEWSGSKAELRKKAEKIEKSVKVLLDRQRTTDAENRDENRKEQEKKAVEHLQEKAKKIREWLSGHEDRIGVSGKPVKSNITDNESAKMPGGHGVVQGYNGLATVDDKHQVVVDAQAFGDGISLPKGLKRVTCSRCSNRCNRPSRLWTGNCRSLMKQCLPPTAGFTPRKAWRNFWRTRSMHTCRTGSSDSGTRGTPIFRSTRAKPSTGNEPRKPGNTLPPSSFTSTPQERLSVRPESR